MNQETYELIEIYVSSMTRNRLSDALRFADKEDLIQSIALKFIEKDYVSKYDSSITSFKYFIYRGVYTTLIDLVRKEKYRRTEVYHDRNIKEEEDGNTLMDYFGHVTVDFESKMIVEGILSEMKEASKEWGPVLDTEIGPIRKSFYNAFQMFLLGFNKKEIGEQLSITGSRAGQLIKEAENFLVGSGHRIPVLS